MLPFALGKLLHLTVSNIRSIVAERRIAKGMAQ